jgi:hypothetical protein
MEQMDKLLSMVNEMSDEKVKTLENENEELKKEITELRRKLTDIQMILQSSPPQNNNFPPRSGATCSAGEIPVTDEEVEVAWQEVKRKPPPMKKNHHTPSIFRGTDYRHNPVMTQKVHAMCVEFGYNIPDMEVINGGYQAPEYMPVDTIWSYEFGKPVHYRSKESPYFKTNMCHAALTGKVCDGRENCSDLENTCFYCHNLKDMRPFRKFIYGRKI